MYFNQYVRSIVSGVQDSTRGFGTLYRPTAVQPRFVTVSTHRYVYSVCVEYCANDVV